MGGIARTTRAEVSTSVGCPAALNFQAPLELTDALRVLGQIAREPQMLTILAIIAGPILVATILMIAVFEIKDAWDRNRLN